jgi:hypothetical protein
MKKGLLIILALTILISVVFAQDYLQPGQQKNAVQLKSPGKVDVTPTVRYDTATYNFSIAPVTLLMSYYDYMIGGYNDLPLCVEPDPEFGGYFMTFHGKRSPLNPPASNRRAFYSYINDLGVVQNMNEITNVNNWEGYPSMAVDPVSGKPMYAWHSQLETAADPYDVEFAYDAFLSGAAGLLSTPVVVRDNYTTLTTNPPVTDNEYLWPTIQIGPSPTAGMRRAYILSRNTTPHVTGVTVPSENVWIDYADFNADMLEMGENLVWNSTTIPTLDQWNVAADNTFRRPNYGFTVGDDGRIYYVGYHDPSFVTPAGTIVEPELDAFVCDNYGAGEWTRVQGEGSYYQWGPRVDFGEGDPWITQSDGTTPVPVDSIYMSISNSAHLNAVYDAGTDKIHNLTTWAPFWREGTSPTELSAYYLSDMQILKDIVFDANNNTFSLREVYPIAGTSIDDSLWLPWDNNGDGIVDEYFNDPTDPTSIGVPKASRTWPFPYWDSSVHTDAMFFHYGNTKITEPNEQGMMAAVWQESNRARLYIEYPDSYPELAPYVEAPEIWIAVSPDHGLTWSEPITLNRVDTPELAGMKPMWVYPADRVKYVTTTDGHKIGKLGLMFYDDFSWGSYAIEGPVGQNDGGNIKFAEIQITFGLPDPNNGSNDPISTPNVTMLKQNYPNPFNPQTTIKFDMPKNGTANLSIYNTKGQLVKTLVNGKVGKGEQSFTWKGNDNSNKSVASGLYFYKLITGGKVETRKMMLMK